MSTPASRSPESSPDSSVSGNGEQKPLQAHTCPICSVAFRYREWTDVPTFPFCSLRCKQQDLGVWLTDGYAINTSLVTGAHEAGPADDEDGDSHDDGRRDARDREDSDSDEWRN